MVRTRKKDQSQLTDVELEMMTIIWQIGPCSVHQMLEHLPKERALAYTSVSTMVRILEQKQFVSSVKDGRGHLYSAVISKETYEAASVAHLVTNVFQGEPSLLIRRLLASGDMSQKALDEIRKMIEAGSKK